MGHMSTNSVEGSKLQKGQPQQKTHNVIQKGPIQSKMVTNFIEHYMVIEKQKLV